MYNIIQFVRHYASLLILCGVVLASAGCATQKIDLSADTVFAPPALTGKTVAILYPFSVGCETKIALEAAQSMDAVFSGDIAGIHFTNLRANNGKLQQQQEVFKTTFKQCTSGLMNSFEPTKIEKTTEITTTSASTAPNTTVNNKESVDRSLKELFDSRKVLGVKRDATYQVTMSQAKAGTPQAPDQLDPTLIGSFKSDYVLIAVYSGNYGQRSSTLALEGFLPIGKTNTMWRTPRGLFALYDGISGQKVWEGQIRTSATDKIIVPEGHIPETFHIVVGAAYLLTGDTETSLGRILALSAVSK